MTLDPERQRAELDALLAAVLRFDVRIREELLPGMIPGALCRIGQERVLFIAPDAPPWAQRKALVQALRRLPTDEVFLPPVVRAAIDDDR